MDGYRFDYVSTVTIAASGTATITLPTALGVPNILSCTVTDVTAAKGGTAPTLVACYFRLDGQTASAGTAPDGSSSRLVKPGASVNLRVRGLSVSLFNPNAGSVTIQVEVEG